MSIQPDWSTLHFEQRQSLWTGALRTFRQLNGRNDRPNVWEIWVERDRYFTRHGLLGGAMQETSKVGKEKNVGKVNAISAQADALAEARRLCRKKWDFEGYDEFIGEANLDGRSGKPSIPNLLKQLPGNFSLYKPGNNLLESPKLLKRAEAGTVLYALKRNGMAVWVVVDGNRQVNIYSRRNRAWHKDEGPEELADGTLDYSKVIPLVARYPHLVEAVQSMGLPPNTMLACELVNTGGDTKTHFAHVQSVEKSLTPVAYENQVAGGWLGLYCWDVPFWNGEDLVSTISVIERYQKIFMVCAQQPHSKAWVSPVQYCRFGSTEEAVTWAKQHDLEGWVVVNPEGIYGDKGWNMKGKPDRPAADCAKLKPWFEDDFVVDWDPAYKIGSYGKGKHEAGKAVQLPSGETVTHGGVGSVGLHQYNSKGERVYICDCSGMDYEFQAKLNSGSFPFVAEIKFVDRSYISDGDETNALTFPGFVRVRTDKTPEDCFNEKLDPA